MILHNLLRRHRPDPVEEHVENGLLMSACLLCGRPMVEPSKRGWQLAGRVRP